MKSRLTTTASDLRILADLIDPTRVGGPDEELPVSFVRDLAELVPFSTASFILIDARNRQEQVQGIEVTEASPYRSMQPDVREELSQLFWSGYWRDGGCSYVETTGDRTSVLRASDLITRRDFCKTPTGELYRRTGIRHDVEISLPPLGAYERRLLLFRRNGKDFSDREVALLSLLRPHVAEVHTRQRCHRGIGSLTPRQLEILQLIAAGFTNKQIAREIHVSELTIRKHLENVYTRLGVGTRTAAVASVAAIVDIG